MILKNKLKSLVVLKAIIASMSVVAVGSTPFILMGQGLGKPGKVINLSAYRPEASYMLLPIMDNPNPNASDQQYREFIFDRIGISEREWMKKSTAEAIESRKFLESMEVLWKTPADPIKVQNFNHDKSPKHFSSRFQLEEEINQYLWYEGSKRFSFEKVFKSGDLNTRVWTVDFQSFLLDFYNFLVNSQIFTKEEVVKLLFNITAIPTKDTRDNTDGEILSKVTSTQAAMGMFLNKKDKVEWYNQAIRDRQFEIGWAVSQHPFHTFVHEFGHIIHNFYALTPDQKHNLNFLLNLNLDADIMDETASIQKGLDSQEIDRQNLAFTKRKLAYVEATQDSIVKKINQANPNSSSIFQLARLSVVPSEYGRIQTRSSISKQYSIISWEWFAEGFSYFYTTPDSQKNQIWELWYDFFYK